MIGRLNVQVFLIKYMGGAYSKKHPCAKSFSVFTDLIHHVNLGWEFSWLTEVCVLELGKHCSTQFISGQGHRAYKTEYRSTPWTSIHLRTIYTYFTIYLCHGSDTSFSSSCQSTFQQHHRIKHQSGRCLNILHPATRGSRDTIFNYCNNDHHW